MTEEHDEILSLHRYYIWANRMRTHFDSILESGKHQTGIGEIESFLYMSYWYGGLYVVIEGWKDLGLRDATIDTLLISPNVDLLRRFRNGAFHFQRKYNDQRFMDFMTEGIDAVEWIRQLNEQFGRYFLAALSNPSNRLRRRLNSAVELPLSGMPIKPR